MAKQPRKVKSEQLTGLLWISAGVLALGLLFARAIYPEMIALTAFMGLPLLAVLGSLIQQNQKALRSRTAAYGFNSLVTVFLVLGIIGVLNFLVARYPLQWDLTKNRIHTLSDQTTKVVRGLKTPVKGIFFAKLQQKEQFRSLLDQYKALSTKWEIEYVDPDREPTRAKQLGIKKYGTLHLAAGARNSNIEELSEEKITNALIKLLKEKAPLLCSLTGHGEKSFDAQSAEGYSSMKQALTEQAYEIKSIHLTQEPKALEKCDALAILGPTQAFFDAEIKAIRSYLEKGGRAIIATDIPLKGSEFAPELLALLREWYVRPMSAMVVDPLSRMLGVDASVAVLAQFSKDSPITKDFQSNCAFPFTRPLEVMSGAPASLNVQWIAQTTPKSWGVTHLKDLAGGEVRIIEGQDHPGPLNAAVAVEGKQKTSQAERTTRLVVFGSSSFAGNQFARYAGNSDFFLNSVSWVLEDESLISIRAKEEGPGKIELSQKAGTFIFLVTVVVVPLLLAVSGLGIWLVRRRL